MLRLLQSNSDGDFSRSGDGIWVSLVEPRFSAVPAIPGESQKIRMVDLPRPTLNVTASPPGRLDLLKKESGNSQLP